MPRRHPVRTECAGLNLREMTASGQPIKSFIAEGLECVVAGRLWPLIDHHLVDEIFIEEGPRNRRAPFHENAGDTAVGQRLEHVLDRKHAVLIDRH
jgi:hypothetical protein